MDAIFLPVAAAAGASVDQIKLIFCLLVVYPLGSLFIRVPSAQPAFRHLFSIAVAVLFFFPVLRIYSAFFQLLASVLATYFIARYDRSSRMPWLVFAIVMGHLTVNHLIRAINQFSYETMEVTGPQMVLTMKLTTFAWNVYDGRRRAEDLDKWQMEKRVTKYPSILEFLGYSFYFPGILVGPYLDYAEYMDLINETMFKDEKIRVKAASGRSIPNGRKRVAYRKLFMGLVYLGLFVVVGSVHNYTTAVTSQFATQSFLRRFLWFQTFGPFERAKYYAIWTLTEGASILTGLGFTGFDAAGNSKWEGAANVKIWDIEFPSNFKMLLDSWNMKTNIWLRECIYKRVTPKGKKPGFASSMITFATSAFWHGFASGYYLTFMLAGFITAAARLVRANIRPFFLPPAGQHSSIGKRVYDVIGVATTIAVLNYVAAPFILSTWSNSIATWTVLRWYGHVLILGSLALFYAGGTSYLKMLQKNTGIITTPKSVYPMPTSNGGGTGPSTPMNEKNFIFPPSVDKLVAELEH